MNKNKLWVIILVLAIILVAAVLFLLVLERSIPDSIYQGDPDETARPGASSDVQNDKYAVTYFSNDGTVLKVDYVAKGESANPPIQAQMSYGTVFKSWDKDFSCITEDMDVYPIYEDILGKENVFAVDSTYGKSGGTAIVPIRLCGDVCLSAFDLMISYDADVLELVSVTEDGAVLYNDEVPGKIRLNYVSTDNTVADVDICFLEFSIKNPQRQVPIDVEVYSIYACEAELTSNNDDLYIPGYSVVNGTVFVLPEGA